MKKLGKLAGLVLALLFIGPRRPPRRQRLSLCERRDQRRRPVGMTMRQCSSFVARRSHQNGQDIPGKTGRYGAWRVDRWDDNAGQIRKTVDRRATVGGFAQWNAYERVVYTYQGRQHSVTASDMGYVAYVKSVNSDGTVTLEDYNWFGGSRAYGTKTLPAAAVPRYIH